MKQRRCATLSQEVLRFRSSGWNLFFRQVSVLAEVQFLHYRLCLMRGPSINIALNVDEQFLHQHVPIVHVHEILMMNHQFHQG